MTACKYCRSERAVMVIGGTVICPNCNVEYNELRQAIERLAREAALKEREACATIAREVGLGGCGGHIERLIRGRPPP